MDQKPRRLPGFSFALLNAAKHTLLPARPLPPPRSPHPLPPRYARDDAAAQGMILDLMVQIPTD